MSRPRADYSDFKERVRGASDIVEVVGQYIKLRRVGSNYQGLCPFHHERHPSFNVSPERQNYYCFSCHRGGDVFSFVMEQEGLGFREAVIHLAKRAGIPVEAAFSGGGEKSRHDLFYRINESSAEFYHKQLTRSEPGRRALDYLRRRGIGDESVRNFQLGYAREAWRQLHEHLGGSDFPPEKAAELGLVKRKASGPGYYDTFRNRILFPVRSVAGRVLGFGARVLDDSLPKYINSADSPVYTKKRILYGLDRAWREIRRAKLALLVEGYFDVISLHQAGIPLAVAVCGTAFTAEQARLLKRYTERVCVVTDGDDAGQRAAVRASGILLAEGLRPSVATMPPGEDPDSLVRQEGREAFERRVHEAPGYMGFMRELVRGRGDRPGEKERAVRRILEDLAALPAGDLHLEALLEELGGTFGVERPVLLRALGQARRSPGRSDAVRDRDATAPEAGAEPAESEALDRQEKLLLRIMLAAGPGRDLLAELLEPEHFDDPLRERICRTLLALGRPPTPRELGELFPDPAAQAAVNELTFLASPEAVAPDLDWVRAGALRLKLRHLIGRNRDFQGRVQAMELAGDELPAELLDEWRHVGQAIREAREQLDRTLSKQKGT
jgi:DNA primase